MTQKVVLEYGMVNKCVVYMERIDPIVVIVEVEECVNIVGEGLIAKNVVVRKFAFMAEENLIVKIVVV